MKWYKKALTNTCRKEVVVAGLVFVTLTILSIIQLIKGKPFEWKSIEIFSAPDLWNRIFWSALTFVTLGALLYRLYFYKFLSMIFGANRSGYRQLKGAVWLGLMYVNYKIFPAIVDIANFVATFLYNSTVYIIYISSYLFFGLFAGCLLGLIVERKSLIKLYRVE